MFPRPLTLIGLAVLWIFSNHSVHADQTTNQLLSIKATQDNPYHIIGTFGDNKAMLSSAKTEL
jgi:hypothetical protein